MLAHGPVFSVHRHPGKIAHVLIGARQLVEQRGLSAVLISRQRKFEGRALGNNSPRRPFAFFLAHARVGNVRRLLLFQKRLFRRIAHVGNPDFRRVRLSQGKLVPPHPKLDRVAHGRGFDQGHFRARRQPHVQNMFSQGNFAAVHRGDPRALSHGQFIQRYRHMFLPFPIFVAFLYFSS